MVNMYKKVDWYITDRSKGEAMTRINVGELRSRLSDMINRVAFGNDRVILQRRGRDVAAVVSLDDLALLQKLEERIDLEEARASLTEARKKGTVSWDRIKADLDL